MRRIRTIARLDIKGPNLIKSVSLEGLRVVGLPNEAAKKYYLNGIDEIIYIDLVASLYGRSKMEYILNDSTKDVFVPITAGGGIRDLKDVNDLLRSGADKIAINTGAVNNPSLITDIANKYGRQCVVLYIEAKVKENNKWEVYTESGRESTGLDVIDWVREAEKLGIGEILLTSIDYEGTKTGFDNDLIKAVSSNVSVPIIASGGYGSKGHLKPVLESGADAIAIASAFHYEEEDPSSIKSYINDLGYKITTNIV